MKQCSGNGQGSYKMCKDKGVWNRYWMSFLYTVDGHEGIYCYECAKELADKENDRKGNNV